METRCLQPSISLNSAHANFPGCHRLLLAAAAAVSLQAQPASTEQQTRAIELLRATLAQEPPSKKASRKAAPEPPNLRPPRRRLPNPHGRRKRSRPRL